MTNKNGGQTTEQSVAERIEEARQLHRNINETLREVLRQITAGNLGDVALLPKQMAQLNVVIAESQKREAEFNDRHGTGLREGDIDFDDLRYQIGCRLGRIRECCRET